MRTVYAQTNLQLFNQLSSEGYSTEALLLVCDAYALAVRLYAGYFTGSGRTQIAHVVGTASILGTLKAPAAVVAAGLIHNVYDNGDFGALRYGITAAKRNEIIRTVGEEVEKFVHKFHLLRQTKQPFSVVIGEMDLDDQIVRSTILIEMADRLEHHLIDAELLQYTKFVHRNGYMMIETAQRLGFAGLVDAIREAMDPTDSHSNVLRELAKRSGIRSGWVMPPSYRKRVLIRLHEALMNAFDWLGKRRITRRVNRPLKLKYWVRGSTQTRTGEKGGG